MYNGYNVKSWIDKSAKLFNIDQLAAYSLLGFSEVCITIGHFSLSMSVLIINPAMYVRTLSKNLSSLVFTV